MSTTGCQRGDQQCTQYKSWNWGLVRQACKTLEDKSQTSKCLRQLICLLCSWQLSSQLAKLRRRRNAEKRRKLSQSSTHCCDPTINLDILVFSPTVSTQLLAHWAQGFADNLGRWNTTKRHGIEKYRTSLLWFQSIVQFHTCPRLIVAINPAMKKKNTNFISFDRSSYSDSGLLYNVRSSAATFWDFEHFCQYI